MGNHTVPYGTDSLTAHSLALRAFADYGAAEASICPTNRCDRDAGLAESGYDQLSLRDTRVRLFRRPLGRKP